MMTYRLAPLLLLAMLLFGGGASAQVQVEGKPETVHLVVNDASLDEVLAALRDRYNLSYHSDDALAARRTGVFDGPLRRVAARILEGYDYAMAITPQGIDVLVMRRAVAPAATLVMPYRPPLTDAEDNHFRQGHHR